MTVVLSNTPSDHSVESKLSFDKIGFKFTSSILFMMLHSNAVT